MAANFWTSSHCKELLDAEKVGIVHPLDKEHGLTQEDVKIIKNYMSNYIRQLSQPVKVRQSYLPGCSCHRRLQLLQEVKFQPLIVFNSMEPEGRNQSTERRIATCERVVATAITYFRRVYTRKSFIEYDPQLVAPTCLYLASKAEESTVQAKLLIFYMKKYSKQRYEIKDVLEMEMKLLEALDYYLVIYHPYRPLIQLLQDSGLADLKITAWSLVNDTYRTDLILTYAPYMIALACIYLACILKEKDAHAWFEELRVDMNEIKNISMEIVDYYDNCRNTPDEKITLALNKLPLRKEVLYL